MKYGLIGKKLTHSFSKNIHELISHNKYELKELAIEELDEFFSKKDFLGINVTIPYKEMVLNYLDEKDQSVDLVGACNTIVNYNGKLIGYNTDLYGMIDLINKFKIEIRDKKVLILGRGGASLACLGACKYLGAKLVKRSYYNSGVDILSYEDLKKEQDFEIIFNATPVGMYPNNNEELIDLDNFKKLEAYIDCIYNPLLTITAVKVRNKNLPSYGGLYMLVSQAVYAERYFLNKEFDKKLIDDIYHKLIKQKENITLIGMPSCGKSTIGKELANLINKEFVDLDYEITKSINMTIQEYIETKGEEAFRIMETKIVKEISKGNNLVISTGGGVILKEENINHLKQNGKIYFVDRPLELLKPTSSRPLSNDYDKLKKLYDTRYELYIKYSDYQVKNDEDLFSKCTIKIKEIYDNENPCY